MVAVAESLEDKVKDFNEKSAIIVVGFKCPACQREHKFDSRAVIYKGDTLKIVCDVAGLATRFEIT